jgi:hypothetical protein
MPEAWPDIESEMNSIARAISKGRIDEPASLFVRCGATEILTRVRVPIRVLFHRIVRVHVHGADRRSLPPGEDAVYDRLRQIVVVQHAVHPFSDLSHWQLNRVTIL